MRITPSIMAVRHPFTVPVAPGISIERFVYSYILLDRTITLIDTGVAGCEAAIFSAIRSAGRDPSEIGWVVLTHAHPDHIGAARVIREATGCRIAAHPAERAWIEDVALQNRERPVPGFDRLVSGPVELDRQLADGDRFRPDESPEGELRVIHSPGHSPGSVSLFLEREGALFSGDAVPVPGDLPVYDDACASLQTLRKLRDLAGVRLLLSAWDEPRRDEEAYRQMERADGYLRQIHGAVLAASANGPDDMTRFTRSVAAAIGLPPHAATPLLSRTFSANLRMRDARNLPEDCQ
jgi:glyoxylase-like metal-dependent hydrolase (beta-lactamase superfamily II)